MIYVSGQGFQIEGIKLQEWESTWTNTGALLHIHNINDVNIHKCWFRHGYDQLYSESCNDINLIGNIFEGSRRNGIYGYQMFGTHIVGNRFYFNTLVEGLNGAAIHLTKSGTYDFNPHNILITGNEFYYGRLGHFISISEITGATLTGNAFHLAGMYDPGYYDDINLANCIHVGISGNSSVSVYNDYIPGNRATRYCVNVDAGCNDVNIVGNAFQPGLLGTIQDLSAKATYFANGPLGGTYDSIGDRTTRNLQIFKAGGGLFGSNLYGLMIAGGDAFLTADGGILVLHGIDETGQEGNTYLYGGYGGGHTGEIFLATADTLRAKVTAAGDIKTLGQGKGFVLISADGTKIKRVYIDNSGALQVQDE
jgi:hypothetical protein